MAKDTEVATLFAAHLPATAYVRLSAIVGKNGVLPISRSTFYSLIKSGKVMPPTRLTPRTSAWTVGYVRELLASFPKDADPRS